MTTSGMRRRLPRPVRLIGLAVAELVLLGQLALFGHAPGTDGHVMPAGLGAADAAAAEPLRGALADTSVIRTAADGDCSVDAGAGGGVLTSCADADTFAVFSEGFNAALALMHTQNGTSHLQVSSDPAGANVLVNEVLVGQTPIDVAVPAGAYLVRIQKDGYATFSHAGTVAPDQPAKITKTLVPVGGKGTAVNIPAATLLGLLGGDAIADGELSIDDVIRDRDGNYYVAFFNQKEEHFPKPVIDQVWPDIGDNYLGTYGSDLHYPTTQGVAKSSDGGHTWTLVAKWVDKQTWTLSASKRFDDASWNKGTPNAAGHVGITSHWVRIAYQAFTGERYQLGSFIPRADGGITIQVWKTTTDSREIKGMYDNLPAGWCRADDPDYGKSPSYCFSNAPEKDVYRYIDRDYLTWKDPQDKDQFLKQQFGMTDDDLAEWNDDSSVLLAAGTDGATAQVAGDYPTRKALPKQIAWMDYIGRFVDPSTKLATDYLLQYQGADRARPCFDPIPACAYRDVPASGRVYTSTDGGRTVQLYATFTETDAKPCQSSQDECDPGGLVGPDGRIYLRSQGRVVYRLDRASDGTGTLVRLGSTYKTVANRTFPLFRVDSAGNAHELSRVQSNTGHGYDMLYQFFSAKPVASEAIELVTTPKCGPCDIAANYLQSAGVAFTRTDRAGEYAQDAYPVLKARVDGADRTVEHANPTSIAQALGVSYPALIATEPDGFYDLYMDGDAPVVVVRDNGGIAALRLVDGAWTASRLTGVPGDHGNGYAVYLTAEWPYNQPGPRPDGAGTFPYAYVFENGARQAASGRWQSDYQLWTDEVAPVSDTYEAVQQVSQLIPAATFEIFLGAKGQPRAAGGCGLDGSIVGDLCSYLKDNTLSEQGDDRTDRIMIDLRTGNETAVDGNIVGRTIGGSMAIDTVDENGKPEQRTVSLLLLVENQRLVVWDPELQGAAHDLSTEGVHFTGTDERWTIVNNLALPNSIPCGPDQALYLPPQSVSQYTPKDVAAFDLPCLQSLEVPPTPISGADSWDAVKEKLAGETIDALAQSLPLLRSGSRATNWEIAFGSRDATIRRIVSLDHVQVPAGVQAGTAVDGKTAAIVTISGRILGDAGEDYAPQVSVSETGTATVQTAPTDDPGELAWERSYLEPEATFLEVQLRIGSQSPDLMQSLTNSWVDKRAAYQEWLIATRALLHCNAEGRSIESVERLVTRDAQVSGALQGTWACLEDFLVNPGKHWPTLDRALLPATAPTAIGAIVNVAFTQNPTLAFLATWAGRYRDGAADPQLYGRYLVKDAAVPWPGGWSTIAPGFGFDLTLDDLARLETATFAEFTGVRGAITRAVLLSSDLELDAMRTVRACAESFGTANPWPDLLNLTSKVSYTAGIPCVDAAGTSQGKIDTYRRLGIGLRSGLFGALLDAAGTDSDLLRSYLDMTIRVMAEVDTTKAKYGEGTTLDAWSPDLPALDRFVIVGRHETALLRQKAKRWTIDDIRKVAAGVVDCGVGQVKAAVAGAGLLVVGGVATYVGGWVAIGASVVFAGTGVYFAVDAVAQLANAWDSLDLTAKSAGVCGAVVASLMAATATNGAKALYLKGRPTAIIDIQRLKTVGRQAAAYVERFKQLKPGSGAVSEGTPPPPPAPAPADLVPIIEQLDEAEQPIARAISAEIGYDALNDMEKSVVQKMLARPASARWRLRDTAMTNAAPGGANFVAWDKVGGVILELGALDRPKSLSVAVEPAQAATGTTSATTVHLVGADADLVAAAGTGSAPDLIDAALSSSRLPRAWRLATEAPATPPGGITAPEESAWLLAWEKSSKPNSPTTLPQPLRSVLSATFVATLKEAAYRAQHLVDGRGTISKLTVEILKSGSDRVVYKLTGTTDAGGVVEFVAKYGSTTAEAVQYQRELGELDLTAQVLADPIANVDVDGRSLALEEYLPSTSAGELAYSALGGGEPLTPEVISALAEYAVRFYEVTKAKYGTGKIDLDGHYGNWAILDGSGLIRAYEVDLKWARDVPEDLYWATEITRRWYAPQVFLLPRIARVPFLRALLTEWAKEPGGMAGARARLEAVRTNLRDPAFRGRMYRLQDRTGEEFYNVRTGETKVIEKPDFTSTDDLGNAVVGVIQDINQALASPISLGPSSDPAWTAWPAAA